MQSRNLKIAIVLHPYVDHYLYLSLKCKTNNQQLTLAHKPPPLTPRQTNNLKVKTWYVNDYIEPYHKLVDKSNLQTISSSTHDV